MTPRRMRIDFEDMPLHWAKEPAFATLINSGSMIASSFEVYLNRVMAKVRDSLPASQAKLRNDIDLFIAQEGHHYRVHAGLNKQLFKAYPRLKEFETQLLEELKVQESEKSLVQNVAYCVGFENLATYVAKFTFNNEDLYFGGDPRVAILFRWHNAEEFEHRSACHEALGALTNNYFARLQGFIAFSKHMAKWNKVVVSYMFEIDRANMTPEERKHSIKFEKWYNRRLLGELIPGLAKIFIPFYNPANQKAPPQLHAALKEFDQMILLPDPIGADIVYKKAVA